MSIFKGNKLQLEITGESHSKEMHASLKGLNEFSFDGEQLEAFLQRRKASKSVFSTSRKESDLPIIEFKGNELSVTVKNENQRSNDYNELYAKPRPSHADYPWSVKDNNFDFSGGGRFSGRLTVMLTAVGGICKQYLEKQGIKINAFVKSIGTVTGSGYYSNNFDISNAYDKDFPSIDKKAEMLEEIVKAKENRNSVGGTVECVVSGMPVGVGDNLFGGLEGKIAMLVYSIPAVKGVSFGKGFDLSKMDGKTANDELYYDNGKVNFYTNNSGGINGGISNGNDIVLSVAFRPTPSISLPQRTVNLETKENTVIEIKGRHDSCIVPRTLPVVESAVAIAILDEIL